jgi:hypothetical protein
MVGKSLLPHGFKNTISSLEILCKQKLWVKTNIFVMFLRALATSMVVQSRNILLYAYGTCKQEQHEDDACTSENIGNH